MRIAPLSRPPTLRWLLAAALFALVAHEMHELVHTGAGRLICGAWGTRDFNVWSLAEGCESWIPTLVGPLFSWTLMWIGVALLLSQVEERRRVGLACVFAPNPLGRLLPALLGGGDEGVIARHFLGTVGLRARGAVILAAVAVILPPLIFAWRSLPIARRLGWFVLLFVGGILVTGPLLLGLGNALLSRGILAGPGGGGAPPLKQI
jgi:hypothetical protein